MDSDFKRFAQSVRRQTRLYVREHSEPPPLLCFVPERGDDPRRVMWRHVGAAADGNEVRAQIRATLFDVGARWCAIVRTLAYSVDESPTPALGLVVISTSEVLMMSSVMVHSPKLELGPWEAVEFQGDWLFVQQALRTIEKELAA